MKRIHFQKMINKPWIVTLLILSLVFILIGGLELIEFNNLKVNKIIFVIGLIIPVIYQSRLFWHKNTVMWNKKGIVIRIKSFLGKSLRFNEIKATELNENILILTKTNGEEITFDLNEFEESDTRKLNELIVENTVINNEKTTDTKINLSENKKCKHSNENLD